MGPRLPWDTTVITGYISKLMENSLYYVLIIAVGYGLELINQILVTAMYIISYSIDTSQGE